MIKIGFGRNIKPKAFDFKPRYYDAEKEALQERLKIYQAGHGDETDLESRKLRIKSSLRKKIYGDSEKSSSLRRASNVRLMIILFFVALIFYIILSTNKITGFIETFSK